MNTRLTKDDVAYLRYVPKKHRKMVRTAILNGVRFDNPKEERDDNAKRKH